MSLRALLLSPDDQAVHAITSVLEEMSVSCDRPLDGATAAKKINSERFDLVLVDCDNLPAAKLIFDVCRRSHGTTSVPLAIVDGRAGLPTAFRLGAELILTKPVAVDQARATIRTAVTRAKKDHPVQDDKAEIAALSAAVARDPVAEISAPKAMAAAAGAASASSEAPAARIEAVAAQAPVATPGATTSHVEIEPPIQANVSATAVTATKPDIAFQPARSSARVVTTSETASTSTSSESLIASEPKISSQPVTSTTASQDHHPAQPSPMFTSYAEPKPERSRGLLIATLVLALLGGAGYAGWIYQPDFHRIVEFRIAQARTLLGSEPQHTPVAARPATLAIAAKPATPAAQQPPSSTPNSAVAETSATSNSPTAAPWAVNNAPASTPPAAVSEPAPTPETSSPMTEKKSVSESTAASDFPDAKNAVILSSKGADKRLLHRVAPVVSSQLRAQSAEATIVLKALIDSNGSVQALQPVEGNAALVAAATKAVKQWRYKPFVRDGKAVPFRTIVLVDIQ